MIALAGWRERVVEYIRKEALPQEKYSHQPRLYAICVEIGRAYTYDDDVVFAAVWLHDLGVFSGHRPSSLEALMCWDHTAYAVDQVPGILLSVGFPEPKIAAVTEVIRTHQAKDVPTTMEGQIVRDADILEQLGAVAVLRTAAKVGRDTRFPTFAEVRDSLSAALEGLPSQLHLAQSRTLAVSRAAALKAFLDSLQAEAAGVLS